MDKHLTATMITKLIRELEDIVLELDGAINSNEIEPGAYGNLKERFRKVIHKLDTQVDRNDSRFYIIDEAQGLFAWIDKEKDAALRYIADAVATKGDKALVSIAGQGLASSIVVKSKVVSSKEDSPLSGWLLFFYVTVVIVMIASAPIALLGTFGLLLSDQVAGTTAASYLLLILFYLYAILSGFYVVSTPARSRYATPAAIMLFTLLSLGCIAMVVGPFTEGTGSDAPAAYYIILALLIASGIATTTYYATSSKVRRVFNK